MWFHIKAASGVEPPCSQAVYKPAVFQNKYNIPLKEAENKKWFQTEKEFCTDWYEKDGVLYMNYKPEYAYFIDISSLEDLCKLKEGLDYDISLVYSDYEGIFYGLVIHDSYYG